MSARSDSVADTFAEVPDEMKGPIVAESIAMMRRAAVERAVVAAQRARARRDARRHEATPTLDREYLRALERLLAAVETERGLTDQDDETEG